MKPAFVTSDFTQEFNAIIKKFKRDEVLVGIPEADTERKAKDESGNEVTPQITNAALLALNNFGSPAQNISARPVMEIGIQNAQDEIAEQFKQGAKEALTEGVAVLPIYYDRAGIIAANSVKKAINSQEGIDAPADSTIATREAAGFKGTKALIVTGQMRNAITHVLKGEE